MALASSSLETFSKNSVQEFRPLCTPPSCSWRDEWFDLENQLAMVSTPTLSPPSMVKSPCKAGKLAKVLLAATVQSGFAFTNVTQTGGYDMSMSRVQRQHGQGQGHVLLYLVAAAIALVFGASFTAVILSDEKPEVAVAAERTGAVFSVLAFFGMVAIFFLSV